HHEPLQRLSIAGSATDGSQKTGAAGPVDMRFDALGRNFELQLVPNNRLLQAAREIAGASVIPYRGTLAGIEGSWVRVVIADGVPSGMIWDGNELFAIERPGDNLVDAESAIIYRLADAIVAPGSMSCGAGGSLTSGSAVYKTLVAELSAVTAQAAVAGTEINIGAVGDAEFAGIHGTNAQQAIIERLNNVDGIFSGQVGVQINVPLVQVFANPDAAGYPFTDTLVAGTLLDELATFRNNEPNQNVNGLTHLWTGKNVESDDGNSSTVGIAFSGGIGRNGGLVLCSQRFGAGLSEGRNRSFDSLIAAHEIGHNFGAPHDGSSGSACEAETGSFIMAATLQNGANQFSQCSLDEMADDIAEAEVRGCITPLPSVDMSFGLAGPAPSALLGNTATVTFDVVNAGTLQATNVLADFTLPANVSLVSAAASQGNCTNGGGMVNCALGNVAGSTTITVALTSDTIAVGSGTFSASVSADTDDDGANNQSSLTLTVEPAVNLAVTPPSTRQLAVDQGTGLTALLQNTSILDATGVALTITLSSGLRVDSASWPLGACTVSNTRVDCVGATFAALSNVSLSLGVTATTEGSKTINFSMSSTEVDADSSDNTASAAVNVSAPSQEESGGGGAGLWLLPLLGMLAVRRRGLPTG
ncbi:MAG TPA: M12 family metallo-peptidase, partial [Woeseiaceae bacterium]|nr:M12 family metallo-peptidase [Woeseiaceae bacterium]